MPTAAKPRRLPTPATMHIPASRLATDPDVQRGIDTGRVNKLRENLDLDMLGIVYVSRRTGGGLYVLDGQHRARALVDEGLGDYEMECKVYDGLTIEQEAEIFFWLNDYLRVHAADKFRARARFGDPVSLDIIRIVEKHSLKVARDFADGNIVAVSALEAVYTGKVARKGGAFPEVLSSSLGTLGEAFGRTATAMSGELIKGVGIVLHRHLGTVQPTDLARKMSMRAAGAAGLLSAGRAHKDYEGGTTAGGVAHIVILDYNRGRTSNKLPLPR